MPKAIKAADKSNNDMRMKRCFFSGINRTLLQESPAWIMHNAAMTILILLFKQFLDLTLISIHIGTVHCAAYHIALSVYEVSGGDG